LFGLGGFEELGSGGETLGLAGGGVAVMAAEAVVAGRGAANSVVVPLTATFASNGNPEEPTTATVVGPELAAGAATGPAGRAGATGTGPLAGTTASPSQTA
jgi:hypothetical protein